MWTTSLRSIFDQVRSENWFNKLSMPVNDRTPSDEADWLQRCKAHLKATGQIE